MRTTVAGVAALAATLALPASAPAASSTKESKPVTIVTDTASNGVTYRIGITRLTRRGRLVDLCTRLSFTGPRKKKLQVVRRCVGAGDFPYRSPSLAVTDDPDPDNAPLVYGIAVSGLGGVQVPVAGGGPPVAAELTSIPPRFGRGLYLFSARGLERAPLGVRAIARDGSLLDGVLFPAD